MERTGRALLMALAGAIGFTSASAQFVPPSGYSAGGTPLPAIPVEPGTPRLTALPISSIQPLFAVDPAYRKKRGANASIKVVGAYSIAEPKGLRLVDAWSSGFLPVTLAFDGDHCFRLTADYLGGALVRGRLNRSDCTKKTHPDAFSIADPGKREWHFIGSSWGFGVWADKAARVTRISAPTGKDYDPAYIVRMPVSHVMAMMGPDWPGGNITLVGRLHGQPTVVVLEVAY